MRLKSAEIRNYRSIKNASIRFEPSCLILVGINEAGKSNVLSALSLLSSKVETNIADVREAGVDENLIDLAYVRFIFSIDENDRSAILEDMNTRIVDSEKDPEVILDKDNKLTLSEYVSTQKEILYVVNLLTNSRYVSSWSSPSSYSLKPNWLYVKTAFTAENKVKLPDNSDYVPEVADLISRDLITSADENLNTRPAKFGDLSSLFISAAKKLYEKQRPECLLWKYNESNHLPAKINIATFIADSSKCTALANMFALADVTDIEKAISNAQQRPHGLRNLLERVARLSTDHVKSIWKEYKNLIIELSHNGDSIDISIRDHHNHYDFSRRSDGFKRFVSFLLTVSARVRKNALSNALYLQDEPDAGLHPSGAKYLLEELIKISEKNVVVFSTHSIFMIDKERIDRHLLVKKHNEITSIEVASESNIVDEEVIYNALGYSIFQTLKESNIIFEGWRDKKLFMVALKKHTKPTDEFGIAFANLGYCHAKGVKDIRNVTSILELASRKWVVVSDGDKPAQDAQKLYEGKGQWLRYDELVSSEKVYTAEDFLKASIFSSPLDDIAKEISGSEPPNFKTLPRHDRIGVIKKWLIENGVKPEDQKDYLNRLKEVLFNNLKPSDIDTLYEELLSSLYKIIY